MIVVAVKKRAARATARISGGTEPVSNIVAKIAISPLPIIELVVPRNGSLGGIMEVDYLGLCARPAQQRQKAQEFDYSRFLHTKQLRMILSAWRGCGFFHANAFTLLSA